MPAWPRSVAIGSFAADVDAGTDFRVTNSMTGWDDAAPIDLALEAKMQQDGGWDSPGFFRPRVISIDGEVMQGSHADAHTIREQLMALTPRTLLTLRVTSSGLPSPRSAEVRVSKGAVVEWVGPLRFRYTIELVAPDPLKYGPPEFATASLAGSVPGTGRVWPRVWPRDWGVAPGATPSQVSVSNAGLASYFPTIQIDGPVTNPVVFMAETGDRIAYRGTVAAGRFLHIDCARRRVIIASRSNPTGGISMRPLVSFEGGWLAVPVGGATIQWTADDADPAATLSVSSYEGAWP